MLLVAEKGVLLGASESSAKGQRSGTIGESATVSRPKSKAVRVIEKRSRDVTYKRSLKGSSIDATKLVGLFERLHLPVHDLMFTASRREEERGTGSRSAVLGSE